MGSDTDRILIMTSNRLRPRLIALASGAVLAAMVAVTAGCGTSANQGPIPSDSVRRIFERIIDEMRTLQRRKISPHPEDPKC